MKIGPAANTTPLIQGKQETANKNNQGVGPEVVKEDQLKLSKRARELQIESTSNSKLSADIEKNFDNKLDLIKTRIAKGYYDNPQIKMKIAEKLSENKEILREYY